MSVLGFYVSNVPHAEVRIPAIVGIVPRLFSKSEYVYDILLGQLLS